MAKISAFSAVTVTDLSDVGQINLYLTSNQPTTVLYDPNTGGGTYTPNWSTSGSNLVITPVLTFNGKSIAINATGVNVEFTRREGSGSATELTTGETMSNNILTVSANKLANVTSKLLTYICNLTYTDPDTNVALSAEASLTYALVSSATELSTCDITGENVFLYDTNKTIVGTGYITLTGNIVGAASISKWQYQKSDGTYADFPTTHNASINGTTLDVYASESNIWINDKKAIIKLVTSDSDVYDIQSIVKIYDGAAGNATVTAVLSNENHVVPAKNGTVTSWNGAETQIYIYEGGTDVTSSWNITCVNGTGLTGTYASSTHIYTPSALTEETSKATFTCTRTGYDTITKVYTITKQEAGVDGTNAVVYSVTSDNYVINLNESGVFTPTSVVFSASKTDGNTTSSYSGRFVIQESTDGSTFTTKYTSSANESSKTYTPSANNIASIKCILYAAGGTTTQLDTQTVSVVSDGKTGDDGDDGVDAVSFGLGNDAATIACTSGQVTASTAKINIPFYCFKGITRNAVTCTVGTLPTGITVSSNTAGTASAAGLLVLSVASGANLGGTATTNRYGEIILTLSATIGSNTITSEQKFTWSKTIAGSNGTSAVLLQLYSTDGGIIYNNSGSTTIASLMTSGTSTVTATSYQWAKFASGSYTNISGATSSSYTVNASDVSGNAFYRLAAVYSSKTYYAYYTVQDVSDAVQAYTFATVPQLKNSQGYSIIYTRVYQNGVELDPIKSLSFLESAPSSPATGDYYYLVNTSAKTVTLKKYSGSAWADGEADTLNYSYYRVNSKGVELDTTAAYKTTRVFFVNATDIDGQTQFRCEVSD